MALLSASSERLSCDYESENLSDKTSQTRSRWPRVILMDVPLGESSVFIVEIP
jgi:hypothetical protein